MTISKTKSDIYEKQRKYRTEFYELKSWYDTLNKRADVLVNEIEYNMKKTIEVFSLDIDTFKAFLNYVEFENDLNNDDYVDDLNHDLILKHAKHSSELNHLYQGFKQLKSIVDKKDFEHFDEWAVVIVDMLDGYEILMAKIQKRIRLEMKHVREENRKQKQTIRDKVYRRPKKGYSSSLRAKKVTPKKSCRTSKMVGATINKNFGKMF